MVSALRNLLAIIGLVALCGVAFGYMKLTASLSEFDPRAREMYVDWGKSLMKSKDPATAMVWAIAAEEGLSPEDVVDSMKNIAVGKNMFFAGESPFYKQVEAITGKPYRYVNFLNFCDASVGKAMADYNNAYTALMPCTISVVQNPDGRVWLYAINMDFMIYGGKELPPELKKSAIEVKEKLLAIMNGAAAGEF